MSLQIRRGTEAERLTITPLTAELIYTIDTKLVYVGDGTTVGGILVGSGNANGSYGNANVVALLNSGLAGNIIPTVDSLYSLGNATNQWKDLYVSNATIYLANVPLTGNATTLSFDGVPLISANGTANITTTGNITGGNVVIDAVGGGITFADDTVQTTAAQPYTDADVADFLESGTLDSNIVTTANISGAFILGDGSQLTGLPSGYSNADVATYLASGTVTTDIITTANISAGDVTLNNLYSPNYFANAVAFANATGYITTSSLFKYNPGTEVLTVGAVSATGNITGDYFIGDGSQLTNLPAGDYSNANVEAYLDSGTLTGNVVTTGNIDAGFFIGDGSQLSNVSATVESIPAIYFEVVANGNNQTFSNTFLSAYQSNTDITLFFNGSLLDSPYYTLSDDTLTINTELSIGDSIDVIRQFASNVVVSAYSNASANLFLSSGLVGNIVPSGNNISSLGNATNQWRDLWVSNSTIFFDSIPLTVNSNAEITFNGEPLIVSGGSQEINTTGNVDAGNIIVTGGISSDTGNFTGNVTVFGVLSDNYYYANGEPLNTSEPAGANTEIQFNSNGNFGASSNFTFNETTNVMTLTGNINVSGNITGENVVVEKTIANTVTLGNATITVNTVTWNQTGVSGTSPVVIMAVSTANLNQVEFDVIGTSDIAGGRQSARIVALYYDGNVSYNEYQTLLVGNQLGTFDVQVTGGNLELVVTQISAASGIYKTTASVYY
jgi:Major tropism determinant N-terminal domain